MNPRKKLATPSHPDKSGKKKRTKAYHISNLTLAMTTSAFPDAFSSPYRAISGGNDAELVTFWPADSPILHDASRSMSILRKCMQVNVFLCGHANLRVCMHVRRQAQGKQDYGEAG